MAEAAKSSERGLDKQQLFDEIGEVRAKRNLNAGEATRIVWDRYAKNPANAQPLLEILGWYSLYGLYIKEASQDRAELFNGAPENPPGPRIDTKRDVDPYEVWLNLGPAVKGNGRPVGDMVGEDFLKAAAYYRAEGRGFLLKSRKLTDIGKRLGPNKFRDVFTRDQALQIFRSIDDRQAGLEV